jgi:hypothetical protein
MAKQPVDSAKSLCSAAELKIVNASLEPALTALTGDELKRLTGLARELRNKWRGETTGQQRKTQRKQGTRATQGQDRSRQKAELFGDVLDRFQNRLNEQASSAGLEQPRPTSAKRITSAERSAKHRLARANTRQTLEVNRQDMVKSRRLAESSAPVAPVPAPEPALGKLDTGTNKKAARPSKKARKKNIAPQQSAGPKSRAETSAAKPRAEKVSRSRLQPSLPATTAAKSARIKTSGLTSRTRGHVSARGRRSQARRDGRN